MNRSQRTKIVDVGTLAAKNPPRRIQHEEHIVAAGVCSDGANVCYGSEQNSSGSEKREVALPSGSGLPQPSSHEPFEDALQHLLILYCRTIRQGDTSGIARNPSVMRRGEDFIVRIVRIVRIVEREVPPMPRRCSICDHPQRQEIDRELVSGSFSFRTVSDRNGVSKTALLRHKASHLPGSLTRAAARSREEVEDRLLEHSITRKAERVAVLGDLRDRLLTVAAARGATMGDVPGGQTGLLTRRIKSIGQGEFAEKVEEFELDDTLIRSVERLQSLAARELGHLVPEAAG